MPEITSYERGYHQGVKDSHDIDQDIRMGLAQALGEHKVKITDRRLLILYIVNLVVLVIAVIAVIQN